MKIWKAFIFSLIMPVYALIFSWQVKKYTKVVEKAFMLADLSALQSFADIGCGNGALLHVLHKKGFTVAGADYIPAMAAAARRNLRADGVLVEHANILEGLPFADKSFDAAVASYVLHGMKPEERQRVYAEMARIARRAVIFYDYNAKRGIISDIMEFIEGGDYFRFIKTAEQELKAVFPSVQIVDVDKHAAWYICGL